MLLLAQNHKIYIWFAFCYRYLLQDLVPFEHIRTIIMIIIIKRFINFYTKIKLSDNLYVKMIFKVQSSDWRSTFWKNILSLCCHAMSWYVWFWCFSCSWGPKMENPIDKILDRGKPQPIKLELMMHTVCCLWTLDFRLSFS